MDNVKKLTKRDYFEMIKTIVADNTELVNFCNHELELLSKKNSKGTSEKTKAIRNEITDILLNELERIGKPITITDLMNDSEEIQQYTYEEGGEVKHLTNQKISSILNKLVDIEKTVVKVVDKKKAYFSIAE